MLKKTFSLFLWVFISVFVLFVCYVIGVLRNWTDTTTGLYWFFVILVTLFTKLFVDYIRHYFSAGKYRKLIKLFSREKRTSTLDFHFKSGFKIISKKGRGRVPWFLLTGNSEKNTSLLKDINLPVFHSNGKNNIAQQLRTIRWWFFRDLSVLELSNKIYDNPGLFNSVIKFLSSRICKKQPPQGVVLVIPVDKLLNHDYAYIQILSQRTRSLIEQLSSHLHHNIPVFLVISGCEHISGYSALAQKIYQKNNNRYPIFLAANTLASNASEYDSSYILSSLKSNITSSICHVLDDTLSDQVKNEILLFPDKLNDIKISLDVFISTFCIDNVFFSQTEISGVCLSGDLVLSKDKNCVFADILISEILPQIQNSEIINVNKRRIKMSFNLVIVMAILCFLGYSAYNSYNVYALKPGSVDTSHAFLTEQILKYEENVKSNLLYFPFKPVLEDKYLFFRESLHKNTKFETSSISRRVAEYKKIFMEASPSAKRDLILSLSSSLIIWDKMVQNESLSELTKYPCIHESLKITKPQEKISSIASLAIERDEIQQNNGIKNIDVFRNLLTELIKSDPSYSWFISEYVNIPAVNITDFWEDENSSIYLSGIWTQQGQDKLHHWYAHIKEAYGRYMVPEALSSFVQYLDESRQEHFRQFIMAIARERKDSHSGLMNPLQLTNIINNRSSEQKFFQFIDEELRNIPASSAQDWLSDFRLLYRLFSLKADNGMKRQIKQFELMLRIYLLSVFNSSQMYKTPDHITTWMGWQNALRNAVNSELHTASSVELTKNAMRSDPKNKLVILFDEFEKVRSIINSNNTDPVIDSVWDIYERQIFQLLDHAVTYTGCWINEQWKNSVLSQLNSGKHNFSHTEMQGKIYKNIINFLHGPANGTLALDPEGARLLSFKDRSISFSPSFLSFLNNIVSPDDLIDVQFRERTQNKDELINVQGQLDVLNQTLQKVESQPYKITISSAPATISGNPRVKPIGTNLVLECKTGNSSIRSMNFADSGIFTWYPGGCNSVSIDISFPDFSTIYKFTGESAWIDFINKFSDGEDELMTENFSPEPRSLLESMGIKGILVRYKLSDASDLSQAYIEWEQLKLEKDKLEKLQDNLSNKLFTMHSWENSGWISRLPRNITICPAVQE
ncbi:type VI secretion protein [Salmonella enterica]|uniref:type VI secretion protein IcmF/TssM N-terminal domain-containing protein n=1 Tax=Salmonella enterica TaxID=28901 RepID=UPI0015C65316|nr:type VI secretion protein IcmF/TssM N-terminal domain-containing protein [Salmonella enterica]EIU5772759.1 type VI secretion protein [Salmonella enterica]NYA57889.1 type VI secretion protein [Salmonella enterica]